MAEDDTVPELDLAGLNCPMPALRTRRRLKRMRPGERVRVIATDPLAGIDVPHAVREAGGRLVDRTSDPETGVATFLIEAGPAPRRDDGGASGEA